MEMEQPPVKPPRGVKPSKETSGLLMSVIRTLSASETNEQRDREKAKLENEYKQCDRRLDELVSKHEQDLLKVMQLFGMLSQQITESKEKIRMVKENLKACKSLLCCRRDELKTLWVQGLEQKYMLQFLEEIERINDVPNQLSTFLSRKHYLHATQLLVEAVTLGKGTLEGVESLKELSTELEQKKEQLHVQLLNEVKQYLYVKPSQRVISLWRQGSNRDRLMRDSSLRRSGDRSSFRHRSGVRRNLMETTPKFQGKLDDFNVTEDLDASDPESDPEHFITILVKSLSLLDKLPYAMNEIKSEIQSSLLNIIHRTTQHVNDFFNFQSDESNKDGKQHALVELIQMLFEQFKNIADAHAVLLQNFSRACKARKIEVEVYDMSHFWSQVQAVLQVLLTDYLDIQNISSESQLSSDFTSSSDITVFFSRRKPQNKKKMLFKFDSSLSALTLSSQNNSNPMLKNRNKLLVCSADPNNIIYLFIPFILFIEHIENAMGMSQGGPCELRQFLANYVSNVYLKAKAEEIKEQIESAIRSSEAWKATVLLDVTSDYKPLLVSTVAVEKYVRQWHNLLTALPLYSEKIAENSYSVLKDYKETCYAAYQGIVQPHSEDKRICSTSWLNDEDISRFLKSLPNWLNLKAQQEFHTRNERRRTVRRDLQSQEEESPEEIRERNMREAEMLASNLGEGGISSGQILSDMDLLKQLAQLQESMEWFSVRMFEFISEFRHDPTLSPPTVNGITVDMAPQVSPGILHQLTSVAQEFDELANTCLLLLHLEVRVQCFHYLHAQSYLNKETHEPDPKVLELSRVLASVDEAMTSSLHPRKCKYIFEGLGHLIAKILISSTHYMQIIDEVGIQRICRNIFALQQTLTNITMTREVALDHARHYFELFFLTPEEILNGVVEKGAEFSELEYMNAFQLLCRTQGKKDPDLVKMYFERLSDILRGVGVTV